jgi:NAD(P)-dependent dehydrogenase (short-subunit alcohol dehydrogenase family)
MKMMSLLQRAAATDPFSLDGRVAVVTGASSGLGARYVHCLAGAGATVVLAGRRAGRLTDVAEGVADAVVVPCDLSDEADQERLVATALERAGRIDVLVNNAGISEITPAEQESLDSFRRVLELNLIATFRLAQLAATAMMAGSGGSIVNIASIFGLVGVGQMPQASYAASKGAVVNLTRELAAQWARRRVRVNAIAPGFFPSEMTGDMFDDEHASMWLRRKIPMGRPGEVHEFDGALLLLASDAGSYITGQTIAVDGGWTAV